MKKLILLLLLLTAPAWAGNEHSIVAVVNGMAISNYDVDTRLDFIMKSSNLPRSARAKLRPQILNNLINEEIQKQEAERLKIKLLEEEFQMGLDTIAKNNGLKRTELKTYFKQQGISGEEFLKKIRAELLWGKILERRVRPTIYVSPQEVEDAVSSGLGEAQFLVSKIIIPIEEGREEYVRELSEKLSSDLNTYKVNFDETAKSFSIEPPQKEWVHDTTLQSVKIGKVSAPMKSGDSYVIYKVLDKRALVPDNGRKATVTVKHFSTSLDGISKSAAKKKLQKAAARRNACKNDRFDNGVFEFSTTTKIPGLSPRVQQMVIPMNTGGKQTFSENNTLYMVLLCDKKLPPPVVVDRKQVKESLMAQKFHNEVVAYMRKLTQEAFIEIREEM